MSKRIVVGLDGSPYARSALNMAIRRARIYNSTLIGVTVIDRPSIEHLSVGAQPGAFQISEETVSSMLNDAKNRAEDLVAQFRMTCDLENIEHEDIIYTGIPCEGLAGEGQTADLIITGLRTFFHYPTQEGPGDTLKLLMKEPVCPVLAVTENQELPKNVIITYDGSKGAARALHAYANVTPDIPEIYPVTLLCVAADYDKNKYHMEKAARFLRGHGIDARTMLRTGTPVDAIREVIRELSPALVILGSPQRKGLTELLFGSTASAIIKDGEASIFVYH